MRLAIISDIHSNLEALTEALSVIDENKVQDIVCLGDVVGYGADPHECLELVRSRCRIIIKGNHDDAAVDLAGVEHFSTHARIAVEWTHGQLSKAERIFLKNLPMTAEMDQLFFVHASPFEPGEWIYVLSAIEARQAFRFMRHDVGFIGHSHVPFVVSESGEDAEVKHGERYLINVGSIGQPRDFNPQLSFGLFDTDAWKYTNVRRTYDTSVAAEKILNAGLPRRLADRLHRGI